MRIGIYCRVSSEEQQERGTIENQIEFATKYCDLHKLDIIEWYKDDGVTGTIPLEMRPAGARILEDAKANRFNLLLIYRLDRLGRSARIILNAVYELEQYGIKIRSMTEPFDTGDPNGRFLLTILAGVADLERETILERMWYGANRAARAGRWLGGIVPYGYHVQDGHLEINRDPLPGSDLSEADVVSLIFRLIVENKYSTIKIADYLNALKIPTSYSKDNRLVKHGKRKVKTAGIWRPGRVRSIIVNTTYKGLHQYGKRSKKERELITREVPAIVSEEIWEQAQLILRENQLEALKNSKQQFLLRGKIKCGKCGLTYHGVSYKGPQQKPKLYYVCGGKTAYRGPLQGKCTSKNVPMEWIEELVWKTCIGFINNPGEALDELAATMEDKKSQNANLKKEIEMVSKAAEEMEVEKQSILDLYRKRIINSHDVELQLQKIDREKAAIENRIKELNRQVKSEADLADRFDTVEELLTDMRSMIRQEDPPFEVKREIVKALVKEIVVDTEISEHGRPLATITVKYTFVKDVIGTRERAENNFDTEIVRRENMPPWLLGHQWYGDSPGARLRQARIAKNMTIRDLAMAVGLTKEALIRLESNKNKASLPHLRSLSQILGVPVAHLGGFEKLTETTLGQRIKKARLYHGLTKAEFAKEIGVDVKTLRSWENGFHQPLGRFLEKLDFSSIVVSLFFNKQPQAIK